MGLLFKQLVDSVSFTYTYILGCSRNKEVAIVDSVCENFDSYIQILKNNDWQLKYLIETHVHADHITAVNLLKNNFPFAECLVSPKSEVVYKATRVKNKEIKSLGEVSLQFFETPGHTPDSLSILVEGNRLLTGDCMFIGSCGRTDFQAGSNKDMFESLKMISQLPDETLIFPGHDYNKRFVSMLQEEKLTNKQLMHDSLQSFTNELNSWNLPPPKRIKESVPANLKGGL